MEQNTTHSETRYPLSELHAIEQAVEFLRNRIETLKEDNQGLLTLLQEKTEALNAMREAVDENRSLDAENDLIANERDSLRDKMDELEKENRRQLATIEALRAEIMRTQMPANLRATIDSIKSKLGIASEGTGNSELS
jgi:hypothetical protein